MYSLHVTHFYFFEGELLIRFMIPIILFLDVQLMVSETNFCQRYDMLRQLLWVLYLGGTRSKNLKKTQSRTQSNLQHLLILLMVVRAIRIIKKRAKGLGSSLKKTPWLAKNKALKKIDPYSAERIWLIIDPEGAIFRNFLKNFFKILWDFSNFSQRFRIFPKFRLFTVTFSLLDPYSAISEGAWNSRVILHVTS